MMCKKCCAVSKLVFGALILLNVYVWPKMLGVDGWLAFFGFLLVIGGFLKLVMPTPACCRNACGPDVAAKPKKGKKR